MTNPEKDTKGTSEATAKQLNINDHLRTAFEDMIFQGLTSGGVQFTATKGFGKSRMLFAIAEELMKHKNIRVFIFDGSLAWLYGFNKIPVFSISEHDIIGNYRKSTEDLEKYKLVNWNQVKLALKTHKDILFNLKTQKPSKRGFFIRKVIKYLDTLQREEKETTAKHENTKALCYILEEAQDAFNSRSTASSETEEFLTIFNEARNNKESFFSCSQRLTDMSKTIRAKQIQVYGRLSSEDITPALRRLEKEENLSLANMPYRCWLYNGRDLKSPDFKQSGKPYKINAEIKEAWLNSLPKEEPLTLSEKIAKFLNLYVPKQEKQVSNSFFESENLEESELNPDSENFDSESEIEIDESEEYPEEWGL